MWDNGSDSLMGEWENSEEEEGDGDSLGDEGDTNTIKYMYRDATWNKTHLLYAPRPMPFTGTTGSNFFWNHMPTMMQLFEIFWPFHVLERIVLETNRYATERDVNGKTIGRADWKDVTVPCLKAFLAILLYMGMKRQPNRKSYWHKKGSVFHCPIISKIMSRSRFEALVRCLHLTNPATYVRERNLPGYDKMGQLHWLLNGIRDSCQSAWHLGKYGTVDEMMIRYKGSYCPSRQYMPKKPQKWGIKVWCLADSTSKFVSNFEIYCGKAIVQEGGGHVASRESTLACDVVLNLLRNHEGKGHVIVMDNYFTSIALFKTLLERGIYATGTLRTNRVGIPLALKDTKAYSRSVQGTLEWRMHESRAMTSVVWKDKRPVLLLSTHARPIQFPCEFPVVTVPRRNGAIREYIQTSPVHHEYTVHMRGVDVADQLRASYCSQNQSHKWWHRVFLFLLDMSIVNMYIMHVDECLKGENPRRPLTHLQFRTELCRHLLHEWRGNAEAQRKSYCYPSTSNTRGICVVCNNRARWPRTFCRNCDGKFMCARRGCFEAYHDALVRGEE